MISAEKCRLCTKEAPYTIAIIVQEPPTILRSPAFYATVHSESVRPYERASQKGIRLTYTGKRKMKNILFYGDSNTWGFDPSTGGRYPLENRWTTICTDILGGGYHCVAGGLNGRMTAFDDPVKGCRNGLEGLDYELQTHKPLDLLVIMLGTNDLKYTDAEGSATGMQALLRKALSANERFHLSYPVFPEETRILLISPVLITGTVNDNAACNEAEESKQLGCLYGKLARECGIWFLDAANVTGPSVTDGVHLSPEGHGAIAMAVAEKIREIFEEVR